MQTRSFLVALAVILALGFVSPTFGEDGFRVIVNPANGVSSMTKAQVSKIFLKKTARWSDGTSTEPVDQPDSSDVRDAFSSAVHGKSTGQVIAYWQQKIFSGRGIPPAVLDSDAAVIGFVKSNPGAVGYVSVSAPLDGTKVLDVR